MPARRIRAAVIKDLVRAGWRPPSPADAQTDRILDDIERIGGDERHNMTLTPHEQRILGMVADGWTVKQIAQRLGRSTETIKSQNDSIREKLGARNSCHAVSIAIRAGEI